MARSSAAPPNLLQCVPCRNVASEETAEGRVVLLRPRYMSGPLARWLQPHLRRPHFHVKLDELGSFVWRQCDGEATVSAIVEAMQARFPDRADQCTERLRLFLAELERGKMIRMRLPGQSG